MDKQNIRRALTVGACLAVITVAIHISGDAPSIWRKFLQYLFFLPGVIAAFWFGWRGGLLTAILATLCYAPSLTALTVEQAGESLDLLLIGSLLGFLADREHRKTRLLEKTTAELSAAYDQLQRNVERWKQAERLSAIGQLSAGLAHEIRPPLAAIEGAADLLQSDRADSALRDEMTAILHKESKRLNRLLTELLDYARPRRPEFLPIELKPLVDGIVRLLNVQANRKSVALETALPESLPQVECDPEQLRQVLLNLTLNAIQAADRPGAIHIEARSRDGFIDMEIRDDGPGIPAEVRAHLFEPFFTTKHDGTGLGLAVTKTIIEGHGGQITVEPNAPRGARFRITIPLLQESKSE
jgi:signal transduction histidine kinase